MHVILDFEKYKLIFNVIIFLYFYRSKGKYIVNIDILKLISRFKFI